jgi:dTDP-glucose pyrophosphorylase
LKIGKPEWQKAVAPLGITIEEAIKVLNYSSLKIVLITDDKGFLLGTISDGDIRRGLLKGLNLSNSIAEIIQSKPRFVTIQTRIEEVKMLMSLNKISQIPIVDESNRLVGLHVWDQLERPQKRENLFVIMAGGKGTRLLPRTENIPKPMLDLGGKPILEHIISRASDEGFRNIVISIHHLGELIESYFGNGADLGVEIEYLREESPLGTAGALSLVHPIPSLPVVITNGDVISDVRYGEILDFHSDNKAFATMAVQVHHFQNPFGVVKTKGIEITEYEEKPTSQSLINAGVYVLEPEALSCIPRGIPLNMPDLFGILRERGLKQVAFPIHERWADIGRHEDLQKVSADIESLKKELS